MYDRIPTLEEYQHEEEIYNDIENLRIDLLNKIQKEYELSNEIMERVDYDVEFNETLDHSSTEAMLKLIKLILKENYNIEIGGK